jgi:hypothetical protein
MFAIGMNVYVVLMLFGILGVATTATLCTLVNGLRLGRGWVNRGVTLTQVSRLVILSFVT